MIKLKIMLLTVVLSSLTLISCGGSGGGGDEASDPAVISADNEVALATAATEAAKAAINSEDAPRLGFKTAARRYDIAAVQEIPNMCSSGNVIMDINENTGNGKVTYSNCNISGVTVNGTILITSKQSGDVMTTTVSYNNFTMTINGETQTIDMSAVCKTNTNTGSSSCTYSSDTLGIDGRTYSVSGSSVSGNASSGYTVKATVNDPNHGTIAISTNTPITFTGCDNGQPNSGEIEFTDGQGNIVTVTFNSCTSYTVSYNGVSNSYTW